MIIGSLADLAKQKASLPAAVVRALEALAQVDLKAQPAGRYEIEGDKLFYLVQDATPRAVEDSKPEVHRSYADIQLPLDARERFGFALPQDGLGCVDDRFAASDIGFYETPANEFFMDVDPGAYVVFLPHELHRPCLISAGSATFRKVVVKVHASLLGL